MPLDALRQLLAEPEQSFLWCQFVQALAGTPDLVLRGQLVNSVLAQVDSTGLPGFHANLLAYHCNMGSAHLGLACKALLDIDASTTRQLALLSYMWLTLLNESPSRDAFSSLGKASGMVDLALCVQQRVATMAKAAGWKFSRQRGKVAVVLTEASVQGHPPTRVALDHVAALLQAGYKVHIFSANEWQIAEIWQWLGVGQGWQSVPPPLQGLPDWLRHLGAVLGDGSNLTFTLMDATLIPERRYMALLEQLNEFAPEWITLVGFTTGVAQVLHQHYPVVAMSTLSVPPMAPVDVWLSPAYPVQLQVQPWHVNMPIGQVQPRMLRLTNLGGAHARNRVALDAQLGLAPGVVVVMSAGARLVNELPPPWLEKWVAFLAEHPNVVWLLVGTTLDVGEPFDQIPTGQVRRLGYVGNFAEVTASVDVVANPMRIGGGTSVAMAMAAGVPVVSYDDCDGGDKVQEFAVQDDEAYFARLSCWVLDAEERARAGSAMRALIEARPDTDQMARDYLQAGALAGELFSRRCAARPRPTASPWFGFKP